MKIWIKWAKGLTRKPEVLAISAAVGRNRREVAALLMEIWEWADDVTTDGNADCVTKAFLDELIGVTGFASAMQSAGWLTETDHGIAFPNFLVHNGEPSKKRAQTARRTSGDAKRIGYQRLSTTVVDSRRQETKRRTARNSNIAFSRNNGTTNGTTEAIWLYKSLVCMRPITTRTNLNSE